MALVKKEVAAFEEVDAVEGTVETVAEQTAQPTAADKAKVAATVAIATVKSTAVGAVGKFSTVLSDFENVIPAMDFGVLPRLKGSNGLILDGDNNKLGDEVQITLVSWNNNYVITPGSDDDEATKLVKYSTDGVTIDATGQSVADYIEQLRNVEGMKDAEMKHYIELIGILNSSTTDSEHAGNMVQISLSPQSRKSFEAYRIQQSVKIKMGRVEAEDSEELTVRAAVKTMGKFTFTILVLSLNFK